MQILITGVSGYIGQTAFRYLMKYNPAGTGFNNLKKDLPISRGNNNLYIANLLDKQDVTRLIKKIKPEIIFHLAGYTNEDHSDKDKKQNYDITKNIMNNITEDTHIIFLSTDKVFDGSNIMPNETDETHPISVYGKQKLECEKVIQSNCKKYHILRLPIVHSYGDNKSRCFIDKALINLKIGNEVQAFCNVERSFIKLENLMGIFEKLIFNNKYGIYHAGSDMISYYDRIKSICTNINYKGRLIPCNGLVNPLKQGLNTIKIRNTLKVNVD